MNSTFRLGRIFGVRVGVNWSVLIIAWLLAWGLATTTLPEQVPDRLEASYWIVGTITALIFLASILAHELGHAWVARRNGIDVRDITLWMLGGVAHLGGPARTARAELRIALAGPIVSAAIALGAGMAAVIGNELAADDLVVAALWWLAVINTALVAFNLMPAAPLDGGRVLSAILWSRWSDERRAHRAAVRMGRGFGTALIALGIVLFSAGDLGGAIWLAFLGWFLSSAAVAEQAAAETQRSLEGLRAADAMTPNPVVVPGDIRLDQFLDEWVPRYRHGGYPVVDGRGNVHGLVTLRSVRGIPRQRWSQLTVTDVATPRAQVVTATPDTPIIEVLSGLSAGGGDGRVLVFDADRLVGIVSPRDITHLLSVSSRSPAEVVP